MGFLVIVGFVGCGDNISLVKNGTLELDKSITIGQAFDKYKYFKNTEWKELVTDNGKKIVQVDGIIDKDRMVYFKDRFKEIRITAQFTINPDDTFKFSYYGSQLTGLDGTMGENIPEKLMEVKHIYNNVARF